MIVVTTPVKIYFTFYINAPVLKFWQMVISWWNEKRSENVTLNATDILYGYKPELNICLALNYYVIIAKCHIFLSWLNKASPVLKSSACYLMKRSFVSAQLLLKIIH